MTDNNKIDLKSISTFRKVVTVTLLMTFTFWGFFAGVMGIFKAQNYLHPYFFVFLFGTIGLLTGILTAKRFKSIFAVTKKLRSDYGGGIFTVSVGFIGTFLLLGHFINQSLSTQGCDNYQIVNKYYEQGGHNKPVQIDLYVEIDGKIEKIKCKKYYYDKVEIGDKINLCKYSSLLGFDFFKLTDQREIF